MDLINYMIEKNVLDSNNRQRVILLNDTYYDLTSSCVLFN